MPLREAFNQKPLHLESVGEVEETKTAKAVEGEEVGLPLGTFVKARVEVDGLERIGAPGVLANV